ncbi:MAG: hypothetical protein EBZ36_08740 [Acidobacteria bacterium]|nr:hypothetical protein [Acidobacteriota bacterium]
MKKTTSIAPRAVNKRPDIIELLVAGLPFTTLIPNIFVPPILSMKGLATQELALALYTLPVVLLVVWDAWQRRSSPLSLTREDLFLPASLLLFTGWQLLSLAWSPAASDGMRLIWIWLIFAFFVSIIALRMTPGSGRLLFITLNIVSAVLSLTIIYEWSLYGNNMLGVLFNRGITAELLAALVPLHVACFLKSRHRLWMVVHFLLTALGAAAILLSLRRGSFVALSVSLLLLMLAWIFRRVDLGHPRRAIVLGLVLVAGVAWVGTAYRETVVERLRGAVTISGGEDGLISRVRGWYSAIEMVKAHPLIGIGKGGYISLYGDYRAAWVNKPENQRVSEAAGPEDDDMIGCPLVHNEFLETQVELGVVGSILFGLVLILLTRRLLTRMKGADGHLAAGALGGLIAFGISSLSSGFSIRYSPGAGILAALIGVGLTVLPPSTVTTTPESTGRITLPWPLPLVGALVLMLLFGGMAWRNERVFRSQQLQGKATLDTPELDFAYYSKSEKGNEMLARRYRRVLEYDPENSGARLGYALLLYQLKQNAEALPNASFARRHGYGRPFGYVLEAFIHEQLGDLKQATQLLEEAAASYPQSFFVRATLVDLLRRGNRIDEMRVHQAEMYRKDQKLMESWEVYLKSHPETATAEAANRGLPPMTSFPNRLAISLVAMRGFHYLSK